MNGARLSVEELKRLACAEAPRRVVRRYGEAIRVLRDEKGFSFRRIGEWLRGQGVEADYNSVYRVYKRGVERKGAV